MMFYCWIDDLINVSVCGEGEMFERELSLVTWDLWAFFYDLDHYNAAWDYSFSL